MPYLIADELPQTSAGRRFREALARPGIYQLPGAHNGQAAIQAKQAGFDGLYLSGAAMTASMGLPDLGIITVDEVAFFIRQIVRSSGLPLLVDGDTGYLWIARTVGTGNAGYGVPGKTFAVGLGCDIRHASRLIYSRGLDLNDPAATTPIGAGCKVCDRPACPQRAFPMIGRAVAVDENRSTLAPYPVG